MPADAKTIAVTAAGFVLTYSGIKGIKISTTFRDLLTGKDPSKETDTETALTPLQMEEESTVPGTIGSTNTGPIGMDGPVAADTTPNPSSAARGSDAWKNQRIAKMLAPKDWTTGQTWKDWVSLWNQESGWSNTANGSYDPSPTTPGYGAYGIAQARPLTKYPKAAWPTALGGQDSAKAQIQWGIQYIMGRYGSPAEAWAHEVQYGWY